MITALPRKESDEVRNMVAVILQTGRSLNCQILVAVQRGDSAYFSNGARESFGNVVFLGPSITREAAVMFGVDRDALQPVKGWAGHLILNGNGEAPKAIQVPIIRDTSKLKSALFRGITR